MNWINSTENETLVLFFNILYKIVAENEMKIVVETLCLTLHTHKKCQITFLRDSTNHNSFQCKHILVQDYLVVCRLKILAKMILPFLWFMTLDTHVCVCLSYSIQGYFSSTFISLETLNSTLILSTWDREEIFQRI